MCKQQLCCSDVQLRFEENQFEQLKNRFAMSIAASLQLRRWQLPGGGDSDRSGTDLACRGLSRRGLPGSGGGCSGSAVSGRGSSRTRLGNFVRSRVSMLQLKIKI